MLLRVNNYATKRNVLMIRGQKISFFIDAYVLIKKGAQLGQPISLMKLQRKIILICSITCLAAAGLVVQSDPSRKPQAAQIQSYSKIDGLVALAMALGQ
jgi:hypothetical protein